MSGINSRVSLPYPVPTGGIKDSAVATAKIAANAVTVAKINHEGSQGQVLGAGASGAPVWADRISSESAVDATNGGANDLTEIDFTGLLAGANQIIIEAFELSLSGAENYLVQLGDSGGFEATGYDSTNVKQDSTLITNSTGFIIGAESAATLFSGHVFLTRISGNIWISSHTFASDSVGVMDGGGSKTLSAELTQIRIKNTGTNTFDNGSLNVKVIR